MSMEPDGFLKYRIWQQSTGERSFPVSVVALQGISTWTDAGIGSRLKVSRRMALTLDYTHSFTDLPDNYYAALSVGLDIETGGHVFQLHFSNATGMNERAFITETTGEFLKRDIRFGFNLSRIFSVKKKRLPGK